MSSRSSGDSARHAARSVAAWVFGSVDTNVGVTIPGARLVT
ncbi:MAG: hypothetical protein ACKONH_10945 [Planctomycetia bacterium]